MTYTFRYTLFCSDAIFNRTFSFDTDCFSSALSALSEDLINSPADSTVIFNSYYKVNNDHRKFRERESFEILFNGLSSRRVAL